MRLDRVTKADIGGVMRTEEPLIDRQREDQTMSGSVAEETRRLRDRLLEIGRESQRDDLTIARANELVEEERQLEARLRALSDEILDDDAGLAETLVKDEGANADEFPRLPDERTAEQPSR